MPANQRVPRSVIDGALARDTKEDVIAFLCLQDIDAMERELLLRLWCRRNGGDVLRSDLERLRQPWIQAAQRPLFS